MLSQKDIFAIRRIILKDSYNDQHEVEKQLEDILFLAKLPLKSALIEKDPEQSKLKSDVIRFLCEKLENPTVRKIKAKTSTNSYDPKRAEKERYENETQMLQLFYFYFGFLQPEKNIERRSCKST